MQEAGADSSIVERFECPHNWLEGCLMSGTIHHLCFLAISVSWPTSTDNHFHVVSTQ